jgi:hypothetical protein
MLPASSPAPPDVLSAFQAATARAASLRLDLRWYPTVTSTMDVAEEAAQAGAPEGLVIVAEEQTRGRGRRGRAWSSPSGGGVYLTFVLRPPLEPTGGPTLALLTLAAGVAARDAIGRASEFWPELKWPNDLMVGRRKLAGILAEGIGLGRPDQTVLVGLGVNLLAVAHPGEIAARATSLEAELGGPWIGRASLKNSSWPSRRRTRRCAGGMRMISCAPGDRRRPPPKGRWCDGTCPTVHGRARPPASMRAARCS